MEQGAYGRSINLLRWLPRCNVSVEGVPLGFRLSYCPDGKHDCPSKRGAISADLRPDFYIKFTSSLFESDPIGPNSAYRCAVDEQFATDYPENADAGFFVLPSG
jgi:hypothetical protein